MQSSLMGVRGPPWGSRAPGGWDWRGGKGGRGRSVDAPGQGRGEEGGGGKARARGGGAWGSGRRTWHPSSGASSRERRPEPPLPRVPPERCDAADAVPLPFPNGEQ